MKIIAQENINNFIVSASREELAKISGVGYAHEMPSNLVGAVIGVSAMYWRLETLCNASSDLAETQKALRAVVALLDPIIPALELANQDAPREEE